MAVWALGGFVSLHLLYFVNVHLLPGEPYLSVKSLAADGVVLAAVIGLFWRVALSAWARRTREQWRRGGAAAGALVLMAEIATLGQAWPRAASDPVRRGEGPNLAVIVLDSARTDHLGLHGYGRPTSPSLDALAPRARVYERAFAASSWTVPSAAAMLLANGSGAPGGPPTLAERLASAGYLTACFTDNPHLGPESPLTRGFDRVERSVGSWRSLIRGTVLAEVVERIHGGSDRELVDEALAWADRAEGPLFLFAHLMDSHTPFKHSPIDGSRRRGRRIEFPMEGMEISAEEAEDVVARYDGGIRSADAQAGRLIAWLERRGRPFLAIVTSDHGESLGESGRWFHGGSLAPELLAVPLLVLGDGVSPGRVSEPAGHRSIPATLLAAARLGCPECRGTDLRTSTGDGLVEGGLPPHLAYRIAGRFQLVLDRRTGRRTLLDLDAMPPRDITSERPAVVSELARDLGGPQEASHGQPPDIERLRSLGYLDSR
jgi:phosphoglycerol transferase MdoB-like AlkP superfamily enzyme